MKKWILLLCLCIITLQFCVSSKKTAATVAPGHVSLTYVSNIQPVIISNCSPCHIPPKGFKKALDNYDAVKANIDEMIARINLNPGDKGFMPFKHAKLSDSLINVFVQWKADGGIEK
jgi:hypothetical protein